MVNASKIQVQEIYDKPWKVGVVDPLSRPTPLDHFMNVVEDTNVYLEMEPEGDVEGGEMDGWHVVRVVTEDMPLFFVVPDEALVPLRPYFRDAR